MERDIYIEREIGRFREEERRRRRGREIIIMIERQVIDLIIVLDFVKI